jgi:DNA (cytosine-5)-methyltransferase 1/tRNA (cytosine38-C5)-methyltransferase
VPPSVRTLELFAGLGGLGLAAPPGFEVVAAYDQDRLAAAAHERNHGVPVVPKDLASIDAGELDRWGARAWLLSPPCQPFTRRGRGRDVDDPRCRGLLNLVSLLPRCRPDHVLVENVPGFLGSRAHQRLREALDALGHETAEVEACPSQLGAPLRRPRQFIVSSACGLRPAGEPRDRGRAPLDAYLDAEPDEALRIPERLRARLGDAPTTRRPDGLLGTFTRSYGRALTGAGPLLWDERGPRWLSPEEILRLHEFPASFAFPDELTRRQRWRLAGNSVHVGCVRRVAARWQAA